MAFFLSIYRKAIFRYLMWPHSCIIPIAFIIIFCYCNVLRINFTQFCFFRICTFWNNCIHLIATLTALLVLKKKANNLYSIPLSRLPWLTSTSVFCQG
jgi:hypothetical protein